MSPTEGNLMRAAILCFFLLLSGSAQADTYAFGSHLVVSGDGAGKVMEVAGKPDRIVNLENEQGAVYGERWDYYLGGKTVSIYLIGGIVKNITEAR
jgi:hypothetical protein